MKRLLICFMMLLSLTVFMQVTPVSAADDQEATIYDMRSDYDSKIVVPDTLPRTYQIPRKGDGVSYKVVSGSKSVEVSDAGLVSAKKTYWKVISGGYVYAGTANDHDYYTIYSGDAEVEITTPEGTQTLTVHLLNYLTIYQNDVLQKYIDKNITEDMSDDELADAIAKFPATYDYDANYSTFLDMILNGGGDCVASTQAIIKLAEKLGYKAWSRDGSRDAGAGSAHVNAMVDINGQLYQLDAGYNESVGASGYRKYDVQKRNSLFSYKLVDDDQHACILSYDAKDTSGVVEVPSEIDGYPVTQIAWRGMSKLECSKIVLPDTLKTLDAVSFYYCDKLKELEIPASVEEIGSSLIQGCSSVEKLTVAKNNAAYMSEDNAIYSKDGTTLVAATMVSEFKIPDTVTEIGPGVFFDNKNLISIEIPANVKKISDTAFNSCRNLRSVQFSEGLKEIGENCFWGDSSLSVIRIPSTVTNIGYGAFLACKGLVGAYFYGDIPEFQSTMPTRANNIFNSCDSLKTAYYPKGNTSWENASAKLLSYQGNASLQWAAWDKDAAQSIYDAEITVAAGRYIYTGRAFTPDVKVTLQGTTLLKDTDYVVRYYNNVNAGAAYVQIFGCGIYEGEKQTLFQIEKATLTIRAYLSGKVTVGQSISFISIAPSGYDYEFSSSSDEIATVTTGGVITGVAPGVVKIKIRYPGDDNYQAAEVEKTVTVVRDPSATEAPVKTATPGAVTTPTPGAVKTPTPGAIKTPTPGAIKTPVPGAIKTPVPGGIKTPTPGAVTTAPVESGKPDNPIQTPVESDEPTATPVESEEPGTPTATPGESNTPVVPTAAPGESDKPVVPTQSPVTSNKPANPTKSPDATKTPTQSKTPTATKKPSTTEDTGSTVAVGKTVTIKNAKYRITGKNTAEFVGLVKGKTVNIPNTITVGGKVYKITSIAARACRENKKITKLVIGKNVKKIGKEAFFNCVKLKNINCKSKLLKVGSIKKNAFKGVNKKVVLKVPKAQKVLYKSLFIF